MHSTFSRTASALLLLALLLTTGASAQTKKKRKTKAAKAPAVKTTKAPEPYTGDPIPPPQAPEQGDGVQRIAVAEARAALDAGTAIIIDVRGEESYKMGHVKGARSIPVNEFLSRLKELPHDKLIITYCS